MKTDTTTIRPADDDQDTVRGYGLISHKNAGGGGDTPTESLVFPMPTLPLVSFPQAGSSRPQ